MHRSKTSGLLHVYVQEYYRGVPVHNSLADLHFNDTDDLVFYNDELVRMEALNLTKMASFGFDNQLDMDLERLAESLPNLTVVNTESLRFRGVPRKVWWPAGEPVPAVEIVFEHDGVLWQVIYAVADGRVLHQRKLTLTCTFGECNYSGLFRRESFAKNEFNHRSATSSTPPVGPFIGQYNFFPSGTPSPLFGDRTPIQADELIDPAAAPHGWHDGDGVTATIEYPYTQGNHVYAFYAPPGTVVEPPAVPIIRDFMGNYVSGNVAGSTPAEMNFNFTNNVASSNPLDYLEDAITNLFVWNNLCHDILYAHGFDEAAGNFQDLNFGNGGSSGDAVLARTQDGSGINNASFSTPVDGLNPTMRMFLWDREMDLNFRDGSFENVIIAHEYAHGLSSRLVGGSSNVSCLGNFEQGGEGWSDFIGMLLTIDADNDGVVSETALGEGVRAFGNFVLQQGPGDTGLRRRFYSTDKECPSATCNDMTYAQLDQLQNPHGTGMLWGTMLWDMAWALINKYGFEPDWRATTSTAGNIRALRIVIEGMKMTACSPSFPEMRDAVIAANTALYGSTDVSLLWEVFARRGLGVGAQAGGIASFSPRTAQIVKTVDKEEAEIGETVTYTLTVTNNAFQNLTQVVITDQLPNHLNVNGSSISDGGSSNGSTVTWPGVSLAPGATMTRTFSGTISATEGSTVAFQDPVEGVSPNFVPAGDWLLDGGQTNPASGSTLAWFHPSLPSLDESSLLLNISPTADADQLVFWQWFDLESGIDGGVIEILDGGDFEDLGARITDYPYNGFLYDELPTPLGVPVPFSTLSGRSGYTDYSGGWQRTVINLSGYTGMQTLRFRYGADESTATGSCNGPSASCEGWYLDDFFLLDMEALPNEACVTSAQGFGSCDDLGVGTIFSAGALPVEWLALTATPQAAAISVAWRTTEDGNNRGFWLERSTDERHWQRLAWIEAETSTSEAAYDYLDEAVRPNQRYYYRLYQEDYDATYTYSPIVSARILAEVPMDVEVYPNPGHNVLQFRMLAAGPAPVQLFITDAYGRQIWNQKVSDIFEIDTKEWSAGCYYLNFRSENVVISKKWIKL